MRIRNRHEKIKRGMALGLSRRHAEGLSKLSTPEEIQEFVNNIPMNFEIGRGTAMSVAETLKRRRAHCLEAAMVAACAFHMNGAPPWLMDMGAADGDVDHVIALFKRGVHWGAVSKSNGAYLRYRDPIFKNLRELALTYFFEYTKGRRKTLRTYSVPVDLRKVDPKLWATNGKFCEEIVEILTVARHFNLVPRGQEKRLRPIDIVERNAKKLDDYDDPRSKTKLAQKKKRLRLSV